MRLIQAGFHRALDFATVIGFALSPTLFGLAGFAATLAYLLAAVHLLLTLATRFPPRNRGVVAFPLHGLVELLVGVALIILPFALGWQGTPRTFYLVAGLVILMVWALTQYASTSSAEA